jgi:hypothetical protein
MRYRAFCSGWFLLLAVSLAFAGEVPVREYAMKTAYLYNFAQLAEWPPSTAEKGGLAFNLCVFGTEEWGDAFGLLRGKEVNGRPLLIRNVVLPTEVRECHILFVGEGDRRRGDRLLDGARGLPILTVTDDVGMRDAILIVIRDKQRLAFEVNMVSLRSTNLQLSSKLLRLAVSIVDP